MTSLDVLNPHQHFSAGVDQYTLVITPDRFYFLNQQKRVNKIRSRKLVAIAPYPAVICVPVIKSPAYQSVQIIMMMDFSRAWQLQQF
uniref:hypothetical protein n=1 Tax=Trichocoleus desertorum TaxID=1481672 RepID=UPI0025B46758|nr:hypothetical protein [Trichocoleus desertorum]